MSVETVPQDDGEIQDLVLMFANSRIPRGSDAFQTLIEDFLKTQETPEENETVSIVSSDSSDSLKADSDSSIERKPSPVPTKSSLKVSSAKQKTVRMASPKPLAHVHWPDEEKARIATCSAGEKRHHARLYVKTTPKPILKHDGEVDIQNIDNT